MGNALFKIAINVKTTVHLVVHLLVSVIHAKLALFMKAALVNAFRRVLIRMEMIIQFALWMDIMQIQLLVHARSANWNVRHAKIKTLVSLAILSLETTTNIKESALKSVPFSISVIKTEYVRNAYLIATIVQIALVVIIAINHSN